jgi:hypothetical protein
MCKYLPVNSLLERIFLSKLDLRVRLVTPNSEAVRATFVEFSTVALALRSPVTEDVISNLLLVRTVHEVVGASDKEHGDLGGDLGEGFEVFRDLQEGRVGDHADGDSLLDGETDGVLALKNIEKCQRARPYGSGCETYTEAVTDGGELGDAFLLQGIHDFVQASVSRFFAMVGKPCGKIELKSSSSAQYQSALESEELTLPPFMASGAIASPFK